MMTDINGKLISLIDFRNSSKSFSVRLFDARLWQHIQPAQRLRLAVPDVLPGPILEARTKKLILKGDMALAVNRCKIKTARSDGNFQQGHHDFL
jgi:hypothetical protein